MKKLAALFFALAMAATAFAQSDNAVTLEGSFTDDGAFVLRAHLSERGPYTAVVHFYEMSNFSPKPFSDPIRVYADGEIMRLKPDDAHRGGYVRYHYTSVEGLIAGSRLDTNFVYRLPFSTHKKGVKAYYPLTTVETFTKKKVANRVSLGFYMDRGDTVFAARRGEVASVSVSGRDPGNSIYVQHDDGSRAYYSCLTAGSAMVTQGDQVLPGTPLALAGENSDGTYILFFRTGYFRTYAQSGQDYGFEWIYFNPAFAMSRGASRVNSSEPLVAVSYKELVTQELSSRDKKRYDSHQLPQPRVPAGAAEAVRALAAMGPARPAPAAAGAVSTAASSGTSTAAAPAAPSERPFQLESFRDRDGKYTVTARKNAPGVYSVILTFRDVYNYDIPAVVVDTVSVSRPVVQALPADPKRTWSASYNYSYRLGIATVRPDTNIVYRLPFKPRGQYRANSRWSNSSGQWAQGFFTNKNDTVFAVRQGVVAQVQPLPQPKVPDNAPAGYRPPPASSRIIIQHPDGVSSEYYSGVGAASVTVFEGQAVEAGQPIGTTATGMFYITFRYIDIDEEKFRSNTFNPIFVTPEGNKRLELY